MKINIRMIMKIMYYYSFILYFISHPRIFNVLMRLNNSYVVYNILIMTLKAYDLGCIFFNKEDHVVCFKYLFHVTNSLYIPAGEINIPLLLLEWVLLFCFESDKITFQNILWWIILKTWLLLYYYKFII